MFRVALAFCALSLAFGHGLVSLRTGNNAVSLLQNQDCTEDAPCDVKKWPSHYEGRSLSFNSFYFNLDAADVYLDGVYASVTGWDANDQDIRLDMYVACDYTPSRDQSEAWNRNAYQNANWVRGDAMSYCYSRGGKSLMAMLYIYDPKCIKTSCFFRLSFGLGTTTKIDFFETVKAKQNTWRSDMFKVSLRNIDELQIATRTLGAESHPYSNNYLYSKRNDFPRTGSYDRRSVSSYVKDEKAHYSCIEYKNPSDGDLYIAYDANNQCDSGEFKGDNSTKCTYEVQVWVNVQRPCKFEEI